MLTPLLSRDYPFLGRAHCFIFAVYAAEPATGAAFTFVHFVAHNHDVLGTGFGLGNGGCPADPFVPREWRYVLPRGEHFPVGQDSLAHIGR